MAHLYRVVACVLFLVSWSSPAAAVSPSYGPWGPNGDPATYCPAAFTAANIAQYGWADYSIFYSYASNQQSAICQSICSNASLCGVQLGTIGRTSGTVTQSRVYSCPLGYGLNVATGLCEQTVPPPNNCSVLSGKFAGNYTGQGSLGPKRFCELDAASGDIDFPGCFIVGEADFGVGQSPNVVWTGSFSFTGDKCAADPAASPDATSGNAPDPSQQGSAPTQCPVGKVAGSVNGQTVCVDPGTSDTTTKKGTTTTTETQPDGTQVQKETTTTTTCGPSGCTTTTEVMTTTTPPGGTGTSQTTTNTGTCTAGQPGCGNEDKDPSRFGGSCAAFSCDGDAIFCAVALEQHRRNCTLFDTSTTEGQLYESEKGKTGPQYTSETVTVGAGNFNQTNALGGSSSCIADKTVTIMSKSVTLPFSQVCGVLQHLGTVLLFVSFLVAYRIVARG